jgi:hypothetical protein
MSKDNYGLTPVKKGVKITPELQKQIVANERKSNETTSPLSSLKDGIVGFKETPSDEMIRRKHTGREAYSVIARRALVGLTKLNDSKETAIFDDFPIPAGNYAVVPLSLLKNIDGSASLMVNDLTSKVLYQQDMTVHNTVTTVDVSPKISVLNAARSILVQNHGNQPIYVTFDGEYDPDTEILAKTTNPANGIGQLLQGNGILNNAHLMKANPRLISPSGDQTVNVVLVG